MRSLTIAAAVAVAMAPAAQGAPVGDTPDHATTCSGKVHTIPTYVGPTYYVDDRGLDHGNVWLYVERNGVAGLQPDVWAEWTLGGNRLPEHCATISPDGLIF